jgi:hypothetical protein
MTNQLGITERDLNNTTMFTGGGGNNFSPLEDHGEIKRLLQRFECNMIVLGYGMGSAEKVSDVKALKSICYATNEGRFINEPSENQIEELFVSLANYSFDRNRPMILETFI